MNKELTDYIRHLSKQDRKSLVEKALKTSQECGSLANVCLSYSGSYATNHKFIKREQILEEAVDTVLCALSCAYSLDFSDAEIEDMIALKSKKWQSLQAAEQDIVYPLPYEIHLTVEPYKNDSKFGDNIHFETEFKDICEALHMKPLFIDNQYKSGDKVRDVLTSYTHYGNNATAYEKLCILDRNLRKYGFNIIRRKIETVPWHPAAPRTVDQPMPKDTYFEAHIGVPHSDSPNQQAKITGELRYFEYEPGCKVELHVSSNPYKLTEDYRYVTYVTYRVYEGTYQHFESCVNNLVDKITERYGSVHKVHKEFAIYDSNVSHDDAWIKGE